MKKVLLSFLVVALVGALAMPALVAPKTASAADNVLGCDTTALEFTAVQGYKDSATINVWIEGSGRFMNWEVSDDAGWLSASPTRGYSSGGDADDVKITVDDDLAPGVYTATVTVSSDDTTNGPITIPVTATVLEQVVKGPILIAADVPLLGFTGVGVSLVTGGTIGTLVAISIDGLWTVDCEINDDGSASISDINGKLGLADIEVLSVMTMDLGLLLPALAGNSLIGLSVDVEGDGQGAVAYSGIYLDDLSGVMDLLPEILEKITPKLGGELNPRGCITIPVGFIMDMLPTMIPLMEDILPSISPLLNFFMSILPPILILMPNDLMSEMLAIILG